MFVFAKPKQGAHAVLIGGVAGARVFGMVVVVAVAVLVGHVTQDVVVPGQQQRRASGKKQCCLHAEG